MARIITTIGTSGGSGLTAAEVLAIAQANAGYEFIKFVPLNGSVSTLDVLDLDSTTYTAFRLIYSGLTIATSGALTAYFQIGYSNNVNTSGYYNSWFSMPTTSSVNYGGQNTSISYWTANYFGEGGGSSYTWNPTVDLRFTPYATNMDAQCWITVNSLQPYYNGNLAGSHIQTGTNPPNMFRVYLSGNISGSTANNSGVYVLGIRKRVA